MMLFVCRFLEKLLEHCFGTNHSHIFVKTTFLCTKNIVFEDIFHVESHSQRILPILNHLLDFLLTVNGMLVALNR
jgi:hypothetical protein